MEHTTNYSLPQWEENDRVTRGDMNDAMSAIDTALGALGDKPYVTGSYIGTGNFGNNRLSTLELGFRPSLVLITGGNGTNQVASGFMCNPNTYGNAGQYVFRIMWLSTGVSWYSEANAAGQLNTANASYSYIAFK